MPGYNVGLSTGRDIGVTTTSSNAAATNATAGAGTTGGATIATASRIPISAYLGAGLGFIQALGTMQQNSQIKSTNDLEELYKSFGNQKYTGDFANLMQQRQNSYLEDVPDWKDIRLLNDSQQTSSAISSGFSGAMAGAGLGPWGLGVGALIGAGASILGSWRGKNEAQAKEKELQRLRVNAIAENQRNFLAGVRNAEQQVNFQALSNIAAFGGPLQSNGGNWSNGLITIDAGGTHESNPYDGVPMGLDSQGVPNLLEEGEVVWKDYVFSNRLKVPKAVREKYKLKGIEDMTFADAVRNAQKESEERPNDPISIRGLDSLLSNLATEQESIRNKKNTTIKGNKFYAGGYINPDDPEDAIELEEVEIIEDAPKNKPRLQIDPITLPESVLPFTTPTTIKEPNMSNIKKLNTSLRYIPVLGQGIASLTDALGITNVPDYSNAERILKAGQRAMYAPKVTYQPSGTYLTYKPFDTMFYGNQLAAQANATRRAAINNSGGNRMTAIAGLLGADYNAQQQLGQLFRQAEESNMAQRQQVLSFNNAINKANAEGFLKAAIANQEAQSKANALGLEAQMTAYQMREKAKIAADEAKSTNISGFLTSLGNIGRENQAINMRNFAIQTGQYGKIPDDLLSYLDYYTKPSSYTTVRKQEG